jgi:hypothetical protein
MQEKSNKIGEISYTVHTETGRHVALKAQLYAKVYDRKLGEDDPEWALWTGFIDAFVQSTDVVIPSIQWPSSFTLDIAKLLPVRDAWLELPAKVYRQWKDDLSEVEPKGDPDLLPPGMLSEKKDESLKSQQSEPNSATPSTTTSRATKTPRHSPNSLSL